MRAVYILIGLIVLCKWFGIELRKTHRDISHLLLGLSVILTVLAIFAFSGVH